MSVLRAVSTKWLYSRRDDQNQQLGSAKAVSEVNAEALAMIADQIRWLKARVAGDGGKLIIVFVPPRESFDETARYSTRMRSDQALPHALKALGVKESIPYIDLSPAFRLYLETTGESLYYKKDIHLRAEGYRLMARTIAEYVVKSGII